MKDQSINYEKNNIIIKNRGILELSSRSKKNVPKGGKMAVLLTGGAGFIGSHTAVELLNAGKEVVILDNFSNSNKQALDSIYQITQKHFKFYEVDYLDRECLEKIFSENAIEAVINLAGYKAVGESVLNPLKYYHNNVSGCITLLEVMKKYNVKKFVFSSSATVYGNANTEEYIEEMPRGETTNPYGTTKSMIEKILEDLYNSDNSWDICILRYFNPVGAHESGLIGESPKGIPNNLMPYVVKVASGELDHLNIFGNDYNTPDGTNVRDYVHPFDLADAHLLAVKYLREGNPSTAFNLGSSTGFSNLQILEAARKVTGKEIPAELADRRPGDPDTLIASSDKAREILGWKPQFDDIEKIIASAWAWHSSHPNGYNDR